MRKSLLAGLALVPLLAACGTPGNKVPSASAGVPKASAPRQHTRMPPVRQPLRQPPPPAQLQTAPGLEGVIGASRAELNRQFGTARLDVWEGDARKLQYASGACVLDVYLYPGAPGREPQATYVDARRASDGKDVERLSCISALRQSGSPAPAQSNPATKPANGTVPGG